MRQRRCHGTLRWRRRRYGVSCAKDTPTIQNCHVGGRTRCGGRPHQGPGDPSGSIMLEPHCWSQRLNYQGLRAQAGGKGNARENHSEGRPQGGTTERQTNTAVEHRAPASAEASCASVVHPAKREASRPERGNTMMRMRWRSCRRAVPWRAPALRRGIGLALHA